MYETVSSLVSWARTQKLGTHTKHIPLFYLLDMSLLSAKRLGIFAIRGEVPCETQNRSASRVTKQSSCITALDRAEYPWMR